MAAEIGTVTNRAYEPGDESAINDGFNRVFGLRRPVSEWHWKFPAAPYGRYITITASESGAVLAHYGAIPVRFQLGGEVVQAGQIVDVYSVPEVRGTRVFANCWEQFVADYGNPTHLPLWFGYPGVRHYEMGIKRMSYIPLGSVPLWRRPAPERGAVPSLRFRLRSGFDAMAVEGLWRRAAGRYPVAAVRDGEWISRRFTGHPRLAYTHVSAWRRG
ncbi:MAG: GNAT family N-acetyltransferase, partial [Acidobacteriota bacterium]